MSIFEDGEKRNEVLAVRVSKRERTLLTRAARSKKMSVSQLIRKGMLLALTSK